MEFEFEFEFKEGMVDSFSNWMMDDFQNFFAKKENLEIQIKESLKDHIFKD